MKTLKLTKWTILLGLFLLSFNATPSYAESLDDEESVIVENDEEPIKKEEIPEIQYKTPVIDGNYLYEPFDDSASFSSKWIKSSSSKADSTDLKYDGEWELVETQPQLKGDLALMAKSKARHHAYSAKLAKPFQFKSKPFIIQYEFQFRNGQECGGAYLKLLTNSGDLDKLNDKTQYSIMFGPDKCGNDHKVHFIFNHKNPKNGSITEKHWKRASLTGLEDVFKDKRWHQLRLELYPDNTYALSMDKQDPHKGHLLEDFEPPVNPPKTIDDPNDSIPEDWDEREKIPDPDAVKPDDWDENQPRKISDPSATKPENWDEDEKELIPDPDAKQPEDWDVEMDGEWEAPLISNPKCSGSGGCGKWSAPLIDNPLYKGKWKAPMITNPAYKGKWAPRKIPNPDFYEDLTPFKTMLPIDAVAFELWTISDNIVFDNILVTDDLEVAKHVSSLTYQIKKEISDEETDNVLVKAMKYANKNPWMWVVYASGIALPLVLFIAYCCIQPKKPESLLSDEQEYDAAVAKKTDQPRPDVVAETHPEVINEENEDVEEQEEEEELEEEEATEESEVEEQPVEVKKPAQQRSSPRQRRSRKEN